MKLYGKLFIINMLVLLTSSLFSFVSAASVSKIRAQNGVMDLSTWSFERDGILTLDGEWKFYWLKLYAPLELKDVQNPGDNFVVPGVWNYVKIAGKDLKGDGYATFKLKVQLPANYPELALYIQNFATSYKLWVNTDLVALNGKVGKSERDMVPHFASGVYTLKDPGRDLTLTLQIANYYSDKGGPWNSIFFGQKDLVFAKRDNILILDCIILGLLLSIGFYHLSIYLFRKKDPSYFYFGLICIIFSSGIFFNDHSELRTLYLSGFDWSWFTRIEFFLIYAALPIFIYFLQLIYSPVKVKAVFLVILSACVLFTVITIALPVKIFARFMFVYHIVTMLSMVYIFYMLIAAVRKKLEGALLQLICMCIFSFAIIFDIITANALMSTPQMTLGIGFSFIVLSQSIILAMRYTHSVSAIEAISGNMRFDHLDLTGSIDSLAKQLEKKANDLRQSEERFRDMAVLLPTVIIEMDKQLRISFINNAGLDTLGIDGIDSSGLLTDYVHPEDREKFTAQCMSILTEENVTFYEVRLLLKNGIKTTLLSKAAPITKDGKITGIRWNAIDLKPLLSSVILPEESFFKNYRFSPREKEVLMHLMQGFRIKEIAQKLFIAECTVKGHLSAIYAELGVKNKNEFFDLLKNFQVSRLGYDSFIFSILSKLIKEA